MGRVPECSSRNLRGIRGRETSHLQNLACANAGRQGCWAVRRCAGFRDVEGVVPAKVVWGYGSSRTSTPTEMVLIFGTTKALVRARRYGFSDCRGRRPLRSWLEVVFFGGMVTFAIAGARSAPLRRCVSFRDVEKRRPPCDVVRIFGSPRTSTPTEMYVARVVRGVEWRGFSGCRMYRAVRDAADFRVVECIGQCEMLRIFGSSRTSTPTEMCGGGLTR